MKKIYSIILVFVALFAIQSIANAQPYTEKNHIAYSKYPTGPVNGIYTIHLDTFVTGEKTSCRHRPRTGCIGINGLQLYVVFLHCFARARLLL